MVLSGVQDPAFMNPKQLATKIVNQDIGVNDRQVKKDR
jgi:hypothetical protein